jgi:hypothetical protein
MARIFLQAAAISAVVFILAAASLSIWRSFHPSNPPNEAHGAQSSETKDNHGKEEKSFIDRTAEDPVAFFTLWLTLFTGILATFTIWLALSTKDLRDFAEEQARDMKESIAVSRNSADAAKKSAEIATQTLIASQRAWISPSPQLVGDVKAGVPINIQLNMQNVGKDPAIGVSHNGMAMVFDMPEQIGYAPEIWDPGFEEAIRLGCDLAVPFKGRPTVFPEAKISIPIRWDDQKTIQGLIERKQILVVYGCVGYITMGEHHFTPYCFYLTADENTPPVFHFGSAPIGNDAT